MNNKVRPSKIQELAYECKVREAMSNDIITVSPNDRMSIVRKILKDKRISGLPVVDDEKMIGIISIENFIKCIMNLGVNERVRDHMVSDVQFIYSDEPLVHAISKFDKLGYGRFPVVEHGTDKLLGIITKGDIIKCLLEKLEEDYYEEESYKYRPGHIFEDIKSDKTKIILSYEIEGGNYKTAGKKSGFLKKNLLKIGISPEISRRIVIASCEAEMNVVIFTEGGELTARIEDDKITVNVIDKGPGIADVKKALKPGFSTAPEWVREMGFGAGMGLPNIKGCTDEMKIESKPGEGTNLEFNVYLKE